jgi:hypothetical protein
MEVLMSVEMDEAYADYIIRYDLDRMVPAPEKIAIPEARMAQIMARMDEIDETLQLRDRVAAILERLAKSGKYAHITYDEHACVFVLIRPDGGRSAHSPKQLDQLFKPPVRPRHQAYRLVR